MRGANPAGKARAFPAQKRRAPAAAPGPFSRGAPILWGLRKLGSAAQPRLLPFTGSFGAPPANLSLASGRVARWPDYRRLGRQSQVARSSDFFPVTSLEFRINMPLLGEAGKVTLHFGEA